jgi:uncharacterized protein (DUF1810 family)
MHADNALFIRASNRLNSSYPDDRKFRSSMTLFAAVAPEEPIFKAALDKYFKGEHDPFTMNLLRKTSA